MTLFRIGTAIGFACTVLLPALARANGPAAQDSGGTPATPGSVANGKAAPVATRDNRRTGSLLDGLRGKVRGGVLGLLSRLARRAGKNDFLERMIAAVAKRGGSALSRRLEQVPKRDRPAVIKRIAAEIDRRLGGPVKPGWSARQLALGRTSTKPSALRNAAAAGAAASARKGSPAPLRQSLRTIQNIRGWRHFVAYSRARREANGMLSVG